jgi:hypothetical protein
MSWGEVLRLLTILRADPSSMIAAAMEGWTHPVSREALILMDHFDLDMRVATGDKKKAPPHPGRPWSQSAKTTQHHGKVGGRSRAEVVAILNTHGHQLPV